MTSDDVLSILSLARGAGADVWIAGGWGIDALIGEQTRDHRDLDLAHREDQEPALLAALATAGYVETLDWRPARFVVSDPRGRDIDLHPVTFRPDGSAVQRSLDPASPYLYPADCFTTGTIGGAGVPCLSVDQQIAFHQGYPPTDRDRADMAQLRRVFGVDAGY